MTPIKNNILFVANYSNRTGYAWNNIYRLFNFLSKHLVDQGHECFISFSELEPPVDFPLFNEDYLIYEPLSKTFGNMFNLLRFIHKHKINGVYFTDLPPFKFTYLMLRMYGVKKIIIHNRTSVPNPAPVKTDTSIKGRLKAIAHKLPLINADKVYAVSNFVKDRMVLKARFPSKKVFTILNGIDTEMYAPGPKVPNDIIKVFICGRATPHKGIDTLIRASALLTNKNVEIDFFGDGPHLQEYIDLAGQLDVTQIFHFKGSVSATFGLLPQYDIACVPSSWGDACPSSVSEALASGVALITTNAGGIPEMIGGNENAVIIEPGDIKSLALSIDMLANDTALREKYAANGRKRAVLALDQNIYYKNVTQFLLRDLTTESL